MKSDDRSQMRAALQAELVPLLRQRGFTGSFPHFRRITETTISLLTVQFNVYGGSFTIELGRASPADYAPTPGKLIPTTHLSSHDMPLAQRARLMPTTGKTASEWFSYRENPTPDRFKELARLAASFLPQVEAWWAGGSRQPNLQPFDPNA